MIYWGKLLKRFICTEDLFVNWIIADWHINLTSNDLKNNKKFETDARHTEIRLWKLDEQCLVKIFSTFPKLAEFIVVEIFFPQPETGLFQAVIAARRCDPRFSRLLYIFVALNLFRSPAHFHRYREHGVNYLLLLRAAIWISIKLRLFHIFISRIFIGSTYCISNGTAIKSF